MEDEKKFQDQMMRLEEDKRTHHLREVELEYKKKTISNDIKKLRELKMNDENQLQDQKSNFDKFRNMYNDETQKQASNKYPSNNITEEPGKYLNKINENVNSSYSPKNTDKNQYNSNDKNESLIKERENHIRNENKKYYNNIVGKKEDLPIEPELLSSYNNNNKSSMYDVSKSNVLSSYDQPHYNCNYNL